MTDKLDLYIDGVKQLPPSPTLLVQLLGLFKDPDHDIDRIVEMIRRDPSVTAELLKCCNSAFFGDDEPVIDIFEAVTRLGFYEIYRVVAGLFALRTMTVSAARDGIHVETLWRHSTTVATAAGVVAKEVELQEGVAFTAGLLHDVGKIVIASVERSRYATLLQQAREGAVLVDLEKAAFGFDHSQVGARLLQRWGLPAEIVEPVLHHHLVAGSPELERLNCSVHLANVMAHEEEHTPEAVSRVCERAGQSVQLLGFDPDKIGLLMDRSRQAMKRRQSLLMI